MKTKIKIGCISVWNNYKDIDMLDEIDLFEAVQATIRGYLRSLRILEKKKGRS